MNRYVNDDYLNKISEYTTTATAAETAVCVYMVFRLIGNGGITSERLMLSKKYSYKSCLIEMGHYSV